MSKVDVASDHSKRRVIAREAITACLLAISCLLFSPSSFACTCMPYPADEAKAVAMAYGSANVIFLGVATATKSKLLLPLRVRDTTFEVIKSWKGLGGNDAIVVRAAISEMSCGFKFHKGDRYLVFANWDPDNGSLWTNMCELTREESQAQGLIKALDTLKQQNEAGSQGEEAGGAGPD